MARILIAFLILLRFGEIAAAQAPLARAEADQMSQELWRDHAASFKASRAEAWQAKRLTRDALVMPFDFKVFGEKPDQGHSLFISLHGGGNAPARVNDQQWRNQLRLYQPAEGIYCCPRAPTNTWNLWHEPHIDPLFDELIHCFRVFEGIDPNRVYLLGYSAGGDGVFQLAPRMADRWAAAAMMAGHPGDADPRPLRNLPFTLHMGENDHAYNRAKLAPVWKTTLAELNAADPEGYHHEVKIHAGKGHWMDRQDAAAIPWLASHKRTPHPRKVVWVQDDVTHDRFYWLAVPEGTAKPGASVVAEIKKQDIRLETKDVDLLLLRLNDHLLDLDRPVTVSANGKQVFAGQVPRTAEVLQRTLKERGDPTTIYSAELRLDLR